MITAAMRAVSYRRSGNAILTVILLLSAGCTKKTAEQPDHPRLTPKVTFHDVTFRSAALGRDMQYRVLLPVSVVPGQKLQAVYLLHGRGGGFRDWSNDSDVARFAE